MTLYNFLLYIHRTRHDNDVLLTYAAVVHVILVDSDVRLQSFICPEHTMSCMAVTNICHGLTVQEDILPKEMIGSIGIDTEVAVIAMEIDRPRY